MKKIFKKLKDGFYVIMIFSKREENKMQNALHIILIVCHTMIGKGR